MNDNNNDVFDLTTLPGEALRQEQAAAHRSLRRCFERIEHAIAQGHFDDATERLDALITFAREHFVASEDLARGSGLLDPNSSHLVHESLISRACVLKARFAGERNWDRAGEAMQNELVALLSDILENDQRVEGRMSMTARTLGAK